MRDKSTRYQVPTEVFRVKTLSGPAGSSSLTPHASMAMPISSPQATPDNARAQARHRNSIRWLFAWPTQLVNHLEAGSRETGLDRGVSPRKQGKKKKRCRPPPWIPGSGFNTSIPLYSLPLPYPPLQ